MTDAEASGTPSQAYAVREEESTVGTCKGYSTNSTSRYFHSPEKLPAISNRVGLF